MASTAEKGGLCMGMRAEPQGASSAAALVVEDDDLIAQLLQVILQRQGYTATRVATRRSIRSYIAEAPPPQLITLDWRLPDVSGFTVLGWIRSTLGWDDVPVLLVTGSSPDERDLARALAWGRVAYIGKPFRIAEFSAAVERLCLRDRPGQHFADHTRASAPIEEEYSCQQ